MRELMMHLIKAAEGFLKESIENKELPKVSLAMCERAQKYINKMKDAADKGDLEAFNKALVMLYCAIPRNMGKKRPLETISSNFYERLNWEQEFINLVKQAVEGKEIKDEKDRPADKIDIMIKENGLSGHEVDSAEEEYIKNLMGSDRNKYIKAWKVENAYTQKRFEKYVESLKVPNVRTLWHGSLNSNFLSILSKGLEVNYGNGGMFGKGCYFADEFDKSRGYCSISGARWRGGQDSYAFLGLFDVALGNQLVIYDSNSNLSLSHPLMQNKNSVFARKGPSLYRNEYIIYKNEPATIRYIVMTA